MNEEPSFAEGMEVGRSGARCGAVVHRGRGGRRNWCRVPEARGPRINSWWSGLRACEQVDEGSIHIAPFSREAEGRGFDSQRTGSTSYCPETLPFLINIQHTYTRCIWPASVQLRVSQCCTYTVQYKSVLYMYSVQRTASVL